MDDNKQFSTDWSKEEIRRFGYQVIDLIAEHLDTVSSGPVFTPFPPELASRFLSAPVPENGTDPDTILRQFRDEILPYPFGNGHRRFWGWVNSPPAVIGVMAEALAAAMNPSCAGGNHAAVYVERQALGWFKQVLGFDKESGGLLVSGGSMANLTALAVARHARAGFDVRKHGLQHNGPRLVAYISEEAHGCIRKAAELLGIGSENLHVIPVCEDMSMDVDALRRTIAADVAAGCRPVAVCASAGTVNTGAIDPLEDIAAICREHGIWFHVDGSYGAPAILAGSYRSRLLGMSLADSIALDPHKWLSIPVEAGMVLVRDARMMRDAFSLVPPYLRSDGNEAGVSGPPWLSEFGFQQTRAFRALKVWMALKQFGLDGYRKMIEENIAQAEYLQQLVRAAPRLELAAPPGLSIVCFRYVPEVIRGDEESLNRINKALLERIQLAGKVFVSGTTLRGKFALRACVVNHRTRREDLDLLVETVISEGRHTAANNRSYHPL